MNHAELSERIQTVLDGLATPDEARELEQLVARDANARAEFVQWQRMFVALGRVPQASPPEGLVAAVTARLPASHGADQLFERDDVIGYKRPGHRSSSSWFEAKIGRHLRPGSPRESGIMSEQQQRSAFGNRKLWAGGAVAVLAVGVAMVAFDLPPKSSDVVGTIAPAERYRAPQDGTAAIKLGDQTIAQLMQNDTFDRAVKDPQMKALSQDAGIRALAQVLARSPEASRAILGNVEAGRAASENVALARTLLGNVEVSRAELGAVQAEGYRNKNTPGRADAALQADRIQLNAAEASRADLNRLIAQNIDASRAILSSIEASRASLENVAVAQAVLANVEASRLLLNVDASRATLQAAEAGRMVQKVEASRAQLDRANAERNSRAGN
ncbi:MAG TPA: hypothetical protein VNU71_07170 [Burkholderiaceae bacterium]|nr:hypothetical protein [Burkholderiaceae bacterium]